jgi:hypothetical protein
MFLDPRPHGQASPAPTEVNARIRALMHEPDDERRTAEYRRLLDLWVHATRPDFVQAA